MNMFRFKAECPVEAVSYRGTVFWQIQSGMNRASACNLVAELYVVDVVAVGWEPLAHSRDGNRHSYRNLSRASWQVMARASAGALACSGIDPKFSGPNFK